MSSVVEFHGPADTVNGYKSTGSIVVLNKAGHRLDPQPDFSTLTISKDDVAIPAASIDAEGHVLFNPSDDVMPGTVLDITISAVEGDADDLIVRYTCDPDRLGTVDGGSLGTFEEVPAA